MSFDRNRDYAVSIDCIKGEIDHWIKWEIPYTEATVKDVMKNWSNCLNESKGYVESLEADNALLTAKAEELDWYRIQWESQVKKIKSELTTNRGEE